MKPICPAPRGATRPETGFEWTEKLEKATLEYITTRVLQPISSDVAKDLNKEWPNVDFEVEAVQTGWTVDYEYITSNRVKYNKAKVQVIILVSFKHDNGDQCVWRSVEGNIHTDTGGMFWNEYGSKKDVRDDVEKILGRGTGQGGSTYNGTFNGHNNNPSAYRGQFYAD
jgi:hypothetical protein